MKCSRTGCPGRTYSGQRYCTEICRVLDNKHHNQRFKLKRLPPDSKVREKIRAELVELENVARAVNDWREVMNLYQIEMNEGS